jgi:hypothetical protein
MLRPLGLGRKAALPFLTNICSLVDRAIMQHDVPLPIQPSSPTSSRQTALSVMQAEYTRAVSLPLESARDVDTTSLGRLHREAYRPVKGEVSLPSESLRAALNQVCHITLSWKARQERRRNGLRRLSRYCSLSG